MGHQWVNICYHSIYDDRLKELGKRYIDSHNELIDLEPPIMNPRGKVVDRHWRYHEQFETRKITSVDSLRIKALIHNDRDALTKLEEHYREIGYELGVAIYYKVMLGFEGNGDLAERFYRVVEPHFVKNALLKQAAQEVLTLAAIRDRNERARELCDSLGYRLYEYEPDKKFNNQ